MVESSSFQEEIPFPFDVSGVNFEHLERNQIFVTGELTAERRTIKDNRNRDVPRPFYDLPAFTPFKQRDEEPPEIEDEGPHYAPSQPVEIEIEGEKGPPAPK